MKTYEEIYEFVKSTLSEKRFIHSENVMKRAIEYAKVYGENEKYAKIAGILHDVAKEVPKEERIENAKKQGVELDSIELQSKGLIHAKVGAKIAEDRFECPMEICEAIKYHTTGKANMTMLQKIIYIADATSDERDYPDTEYIKNMVMVGDIDYAILYFSAKIIVDCLDRGKLCHPDAMFCYNYLLEDLKKNCNKDKIENLRNAVEAVLEEKK